MQSASKVSAVVFIAIAVLGCSEAGPGATSGGAGGASTAASPATGGASPVGAGAGSSSSTETTAATSSGGSSSGGSGGAASGTTVVINEISATGTDWVELANSSSTPADLSGMAIADDKSGAPDSGNATFFASGTSIPAHGYLLVIGGEADNGNGSSQSMCLDQGGPSTCYYVTWKISSSKGDAVYLLDAAQHVLAQVAYPMNAVPDGETYGRLPDVTGSFTATQPTPGAPNLVP